MLRAIALHLAAGALATSLAACASPARPQASTIDAAGPGSSANDALLSDALGAVRALDALRRLAEREAAGPADGASRATLDDDAGRTLAQWAALEALPAPPAPAAPASSEASAQALRLYVRSRQRLGAGDAAGALTDAQSALRADPASAEVRRQIAEANLALGRRQAGAEALRGAVERGLREPRALWLLGRDHVRAGRAAEATPLLLAARDSAPTADLRSLAAADLGEALAARGAWAGAAEALGEALDAQDDGLGRDAALGTDLAALRRRRADLLTIAGDALARLGRAEEAVARYDEALTLPTLDPARIAARRLRALIDAGRPASAALTLAREATASRSAPDVEPAALDVLRSASPEAARQLGALLRELEPRAESPSSASDLALAAARLDPDAGEGTLRARLARAPLDERAWVALVRLDAPPAEPNSAAPNSAAPNSVARNSAAPASPDPGVRAALAALRAAPSGVLSAGRALLSSPASPEAVDDALRRAGDGWAARALRDAYDGARGRTPGAPPASSVPRDAGGAFAVALARAWALARAGAFAEGLATLDAAPPAPDRAGAVEAALVRRDLLDPAGALGAALDAIKLPEPERDAARGPDSARSPDAALVDALVLAAELSVDAGRAEDARSLFARAAEADPRDERGWAGVAALHARGGPLADETRRTAALRSMREASPSGRALRTLEARDLLLSGEAARSAESLRRLANEHPDDAAAVGLLSLAWERVVLDTRRTEPAPTSEGEDPAARALAWTGPALASRPGAPWMIDAHARALALAGRAEDAEALLRAALQRTPDDDLARRREAILRDRLGRTEDADAARRERLTRTPRPLEAVLEAFESTATRDPAHAAADLRRALPATARLSGAAAARLLAPVTRAVQDATRDAGARPDTRPLPLLDAGATYLLELPAAMHEARLVMTAVAAPGDAARLFAAAELASSQHPALAVLAFSRAGSLLVASGQQAGAIRFYERAVVNSRQPSEELLRTWCVLVGRAGTLADARRLLDAAGDTARFAPLISLLTLGDEPPPETPAALRASLAYLLSVVAIEADDEPRADDLLRLALEADPTFALAANDLGYRMADRGENLDEAERLLEVAFRQRPGDANIADSLGWLRYKRGVLRDETNPDASVRRRGAVGLLRQAVSLEGGAENPVILDHLGDALWAAGEPEQARVFWGESVDMAQRELLELDESRGGSVRATRLRALMTSVNAKLADASAGREPAIAPRADGGAVAPAPTPAPGPTPSPAPPPR